MDQPASETTETTVSVRKPKASLRSLAALLTAITACIAAITAFIRASDESVTKSSYDTLSQGIAEVDNKCTHDREDLISLRAYVDGYLHAPMSGPAPSASGPPAASGQPDASAGPAPTKNVPSPTHVPHAPVAAAPAPPPLPTTFAAPSAPWRAPDFDAVQRKARGD